MAETYEAYLYEVIEGREACTLTVQNGYNADEVRRI